MFLLSFPFQFIIEAFIYSDKLTSSKQILDSTKHMLASKPKYLLTKEKYIKEEIFNHMLEKLLMDSRMRNIRSGDDCLIVYNHLQDSIQQFFLSCQTRC